MSKEKSLPISEEVSENLKKHGFLPIPVQTLNEETEASRYFGGTFTDFLEAAKVLNAKGIYVETLYLEEDEFFYDSGVEDEEDDDCDCGCSCDDDEECDCGDDCKCGCKDEEKVEEKCECKDEAAKEAVADEDDAVWIDPEDLDGMDLSLLRPEIAAFDQYIGEECGVRLTVPGVDHLEVEVFTDWYDKFAELVDDASESIEIDPAAALKEMQETYEKQKAEEEA
ncbi:MAG: hypothetical protein WCX75_02700 [Fibrobacteraceae bacterium]